MGRKQFAVLGLGRFGQSLVKTLAENNCDVLCCDKDIEIVNNSQGRPAVFMNGIEQKNIDISISHCKKYAVATVVMFTTKQ